MDLKNHIYSRLSVASQCVIHPFKSAISNHINSVIHSKIIHVLFTYMTRPLSLLIQLLFFGEANDCVKLKYIYIGKENLSRITFAMMLSFCVYFSYFHSIYHFHVQNCRHGVKSDLKKIIRKYVKVTKFLQFIPFRSLKAGKTNILNFWMKMHQLSKNTAFSYLSS